ncbi:MAG: type 2 isopentenyl-diphosphate Delta-isomerase [Nitriliruptorales bacterium]|nr:type 2 isopentenyl-diphosphate Delta-isomerase [Nitriliruptorales bacterium]
MTEPPASAPSPEENAQRKRDHLRLSLAGDIGFATTTTGLERLRVRARALPERELRDVDLSTELWGRRLAVPLLISCMTGGVSEAGPVNRALAVAAQQHGVALGLGSGRLLLDRAGGRRSMQLDRLPGFHVRDVAPDVLLLANLGAVQLHQYGPADCARLVGQCGADALVLHLNAVQEAVQAGTAGSSSPPGARGGDTDFAGLTERIARLCEALPAPVIAKEVGFGLGPADVADLLDAGVAGVDVAGAGGTNWARVEGLRDDRAGRVAAAFADWGWPTADAVREARGILDRHVRDDVLLIGSGGLLHGVDALKVLCLGADVAGVARGLLAAGAAGPAAAVEAVGVLSEQLRIAAWAAGARSVADLGPALLISA